MVAGGDHKLIEISQIGFQKILCSYFDFDFFQFYLDNFRRTAGWGTLTEAVYLAFLPTTVFSLKSRCLVIGAVLLRMTSKVEIPAAAEKNGWRERSIKRGRPLLHPHHLPALISEPLWAFPF